MFIYIHGFNSSAESGKAQALKQWLADRGRASEFACPDLPHRPERAIDMISGIIRESPKPVKLVGSSLGGFYATVLADKFGIKAALVNPAVRPQILLREALGLQRNFHTEEEYKFTQTHLDELAALDGIRPRNPENLLLLVETGDEVLDYRDAVHHYGDCHRVILKGGDHGFTRFVELLPLIDAF